MTSKTPEEHTYKIENILGIEKAELTLKPGVNVLRGRNATGKTSAMRAIVRAQGGGGELERRDGTMRGTVEGPGVKLTVGKVVRTAKDEDVAELGLADMAPLSRLIDPQIKDSDAAARARIRALVELLGVPVDDHAIQTLCVGDQQYVKWLTRAVQEEDIDDLMAASERLRSKMHSDAREFESLADEAGGVFKASKERADVILSGLEGKLTEVTPDEARTNLVEESREYERAVAQSEARQTLESRQASLRETMGERPDVSQATAARDEKTQEYNDLLRQRHEAEKTVARLQGEVSFAASAQQLTIDREKELIEAAKHWDEAQELLAKQPEGPTPAEAAQLKVTLVEAAEKTLDWATKSQGHREADAERMSARDACENNQRAAEALRNRAKRIPGQLGQILTEAGAEGITVVDGRLQALEKGKPVDWERRLSDGQRIQRALDIAVKVYDGVVPLSDAFWMALDPVNRKHLAKEAAARGLYILTEEPASGGLRVEQTISPK